MLTRTLRSIYRGGKAWTGLGMARRVKPLDFMIIGFPKCGTTSLHRTLASAPTSATVPYEVQAWRFLSRRVTIAAEGSRFIKNPNLVYEPWWLSAFARGMPECKFVLCLRDPFKMLLSFYWYRRRELDSQRGWIVNPPKYIPSFDEVLTSDAALLGASKSRVDFAPHIRRLLRFAASSRVHVVLLEEFAAQPQTCIERLAEFLEVPELADVEATIANVNNQKPSAEEGSLTIDPQCAAEFDRIRQTTSQLLKAVWGIDNPWWPTATPAGQV